MSDDKTTRVQRASDGMDKDVVRLADRLMFGV